MQNGITILILNRAERPECATDIRHVRSAFTALPHLPVVFITVARRAFRLAHTRWLAARRCDRRERRFDLAL